MVTSVIPIATSVRPNAVRITRTRRLITIAAPRTSLAIAPDVRSALMGLSLLEIPRADVRVDLEGAGPAARRQRRPGCRLDQNPADGLGIGHWVRRSDQGVIRVIEAVGEARGPRGEGLRPVSVTCVLGPGGRCRGLGVHKFLPSS